jgi:hypothetical protein
LEPDQAEPDPVNKPGPGPLTRTSKHDVQWTTYDTITKSETTKTGRALSHPPLDEACRQCAATATETRHPVFLLRVILHRACLFLGMGRGLEPVLTAAGTHAATRALGLRRFCTLHAGLEVMVRHQLFGGEPGSARARTGSRCWENSLWRRFPGRLTPWDPAFARARIFLPSPPGVRAGRHVEGGDAVDRVLNSGPEPSQWCGHSHTRFNAYAVGGRLVP